MITKQWIQAATIAIDDATGELLVRVGAAITVKRAKIDAAASGDNELIAAVTGKKICILGLILVAKEAVDVTVYSDVQAGGTALTGTISLANNEGFVLPPPTNAEMHWFETASAKKLNLYLSAAKQVSGCLLYYEL